MPNQMKSSQTQNENTSYGPSVGFIITNIGPPVLSWPANFSEMGRSSVSVPSVSVFYAELGEDVLDLALEARSLPVKTNYTVWEIFESRNKTTRKVFCNNGHCRQSELSFDPQFLVHFVVVCNSITHLHHDTLFQKESQKGDEMPMGAALVSIPF